jgi:hypothetical protein
MKFITFKIEQFFMNVRNESQIIHSSFWRSQKYIPKSQLDLNFLVILII